MTATCWMSNCWPLDDALLKTGTDQGKAAPGTRKIWLSGSASMFTRRHGKAEKRMTPEDLTYLLPGRMGIGSYKMRLHSAQMQNIIALSKLTCLHFV